LRRYYARKAEAHSILGGKCALAACNVTNPKHLELDHIDPSTKHFDPLGAQWSIRREWWLEEVLKCQLLCSTHHAERTATQKPRDPRRNDEVPF